jgi:hypothetical protein
MTNTLSTIKYMDAIKIKSQFFKSFLCCVVGWERYVLCCMSPTGHRRESLTSHTLHGNVQNIDVKRSHWNNYRMHVSTLWLAGRIIQDKINMYSCMCNLFIWTYFYLLPHVQRLETPGTFVLNWFVSIRHIHVHIFSNNLMVESWSTHWVWREHRVLITYTEVNLQNSPLTATVKNS